MPELDDRRYSISEVSELIDVPIYVLRQWEARFPQQLKPKRDRGNRRYYSSHDIEIARRIKQLLRHEKMTTKGAKLQIAQELHGEGRPKTNQEAVNLVDQIESEVRAIMALYDSEQPS